ncbi:creatininase family protein [Aeromonas jandaei]
MDLITLTSSDFSDELKKLPVIIPIGLIEAHGPHLPISVDLATVDFFSKKIAENTGVILAPMINYGFADEMSEYPGTIGIKPETLATLIQDICISFLEKGFQNLIFLSGHGANKMPVEMAFWRVWERYPNMKAVYWNYWSEAGVNGIHHADKGETEICMSIGIPVQMDKVKDFKVGKPWFKIRSRYAIIPHSGGINGEPSKADIKQGELYREQIISILTDKVNEIKIDIQNNSRGVI